MPLYVQKATRARIQSVIGTTLEDTLKALGCSEATRFALFAQMMESINKNQRVASTDRCALTIYLAIGAAAEGDYRQLIELIRQADDLFGQDILRRCSVTHLDLRALIIDLKVQFGEPD